MSTIQTATFQLTTAWNRTRVVLGVLLPLLAANSGLAQGLPKEQPKVLTIIREHVKVGRAVEHSKYEAGYPAALEKATEDCLRLRDGRAPAPFLAEGHGAEAQRTDPQA